MNAQRYAIFPLSVAVREPMTLSMGVAQPAVAKAALVHRNSKFYAPLVLQKKKRTKRKKISGGTIGVTIVRTARVSTRETPMNVPPVLIIYSNLLAKLRPLAVVWE